MGDKTGIEWTDHTFNPWWGCTKVSPACDNCYAEVWAKRVGMKIWGTDTPRRMFEQKHWGEPLRWNRLAGERGVRERVFCASMADVFENHRGIENERDDLWTLIHKTPNLDWQLLTKRVGNVARMVPPSWMSGHWPAHAWLGISVVNQEEADRDIPKLLTTPARVRFLSCEPLLGPVRVDEVERTARHDGDWTYIDHPLDGKRSTKAGEWSVPRIDWVIAGGESGPKARPSHPDWFRALRDQCAKAGVPFLFKQYGEWAPGSNPDGRREACVDHRGRVAEGCARENFPKGAESADGWTVMSKIGKKAAGRELDGRTHDEYPA